MPQAVKKFLRKKFSLKGFNISNIAPNRSPKNLNIEFSLKGLRKSKMNAKKSVIALKLSLIQSKKPELSSLPGSVVLPPEVLFPVWFVSLSEPAPSPAEPCEKPHYRSKSTTS